MVIIAFSGNAPVLSTQWLPLKINTDEDEKAEKIALLTEQMQRAAMELEFETAAKLRDELYRLQGRSDGASDSAPKPGTKRGAKPGTPGSRKKARGRTRK